MRLHLKTTSPARTGIALSLLLASSVAGQSSLSSVDSAVKSLPQCWQRCINTASQGAIHCNSGDNACVCRSYNTGFLTTVITCIKASCTDDLNLNVLVSPLQLYCASAGSPINPSAVSDAQHLISQSVSSLSTSTGSSMKPMTTMTLTTTDADGNEFLAAVPASVGDDTTVFGTPKTVTATSTTSSVASQSAAPESGSETTSSGPTPTDSGSSSSSTASATNGRPNGSPFDASAQFQAEGAGAANRVAGGLLGVCAPIVGGWLLL